MRVSPVCAGKAAPVDDSLAAEVSARAQKAIQAHRAEEAGKANAAAQVSSLRGMIGSTASAVK